MRRRTNLAVTAGLVTALTVGSTPLPVIAQPAEPAAQAEQGAARAQASEAAATDAAPAAAAPAEASATAEDAPAAAATPAASDSDATEEQAEPTVERVVNPDAQAVAEGSVSLPQQVSVEMSDGSTEQRAVTWSVDGENSADPADLPAGTYTLVGAVEGSEQPATLKLTVVAADQDNTDAAEAPADAEAPEAANAATPAPQAAEPATAESNANGTQSVELDGKTWTYTAPSVSVPVGFDPDSVLVNQSIDLTCAETGETDTVYLYGSWVGDMPMDENGYATQAGTYDLTQQGAPGTTFGSVTFHATVTVREVASINDLSVVAYTGMTYLNLPYYANVTMDDGSVWSSQINWNEDEKAAAQAGLATAGDYTVTGTLSGSNVEVSSTVHVLEIREVYPVQVYTTPGYAPEMPSSVSIELSTGEQRSVSVTWDEIDPADYAESGYFEVMGTVAGSSIRARAEVRVSDIVSISDTSVVIAAGDTVGYIGGVNIEYELGYDFVDPDWEYPAEDDPRLSQAGTFDIEGTLPGTDERAICHVIVVDATSYDQEMDYKVTQGENSLPGNIQVVDSEGVSRSLSVTWDWPSTDLFNRVGTFDVQGTIDGTDLPVTVHVTVVGIASVSNPAPLTTNEGVMPSLPYSVSVTYTDGTTGSERVDWEYVSPDKIVADDSPITVHGTTVYGGAKAVEQQIDVLWTQPARDAIPVSTLAGVAPQLPSSVSMTMSDGTERYINVQWETPDPAQYAKAGNTFEVNGYITGSEYPVVAKVSVYNAVEGLEYSVSTAVGVAPQLSTSYLNVTLENGDTISLNNRVLWDAVDPSAYAQPGTFDVAGSIVGTSTKLVTHVKVGAVASLLGIDDSIEYLINTNDTTDVSYVLPQQTGAYLEDGSNVVVPVTWENVDEAFLTTPGTYTFTATAAGKTQQVTVHSYKLVSTAKATEPIAVLQGDVPSSIYGPCTVEVDDGSGATTKEMNFSADPANVSKDTFATAGTHTVTVDGWINNGRVTVAGKAEVTFEVYSSVVDQEEVNVWTTPGNAPVLPGTVEVTLGNANPLAAIVSFFSSLTGQKSTDTTMYSTVTWDKIDPAQYAADKDGTTFTVEGTVGTSKAKVTATVEVASIASVHIPEITTAPGVAPQIPACVSVTTSTGSKQEVYLGGLDEIPGSAYQEAGATFSVEGTLYVGGQEMSVMIPVKVVEATGVVDEKDLNGLLNLTTEVGHMPMLPGTLPVELSDGAVVPLDVTWDDITYSQIAQTGTLTVNGTVDDLASAPAAVARALAATGGRVTATIDVVEESDEPVVSCVMPQYAFVGQGGTTSMTDDYNSSYASTAVYYSNGDVMVADVTWNFDDVDFDTPGTYVMHGTVDGVDAPAVAYVTVTKSERTVQSVGSFTYTAVIPDGGSASRDEIALGLPGQVAVTYSDGTRGLLNVSWNLEDLTADALSKPGKIAITGTVAGTDLAAKATIQLVAEGGDEVYATGVKDLAPVETYETVAPKLPESVELVMSDGSTKKVGVVWGELSPNAWADGKGGTSFTVKGVTAEGGFTVTLTVNVKDLVHAEAVTITGEGVENGAVELSRGSKLSLSASVTPADAYYQDVTWASSDPAVATVSEDGVVTALRGGTAVITATNGEGVSAQVTVTVPRSAEKLNVTAAKTDYMLGDSFDPTSLSVELVYDDGSVERLEPSAYQVIAPNMATAGEKTVTVTLASDSAVTATVTIVVTDPSQGGGQGQGQDGQGQTPGSGNGDNNAGGNGGSGNGDNNAGGNGGSDNGGSVDNSAGSDNDSGSSAAGGGDSENGGLPTTADAGMIATAATGGAGIMALLGAWVSRRRSRRE